MIYDFRLVFLEHHIDSSAVSDRSDQNNKVEVFVLTSQFLFDIVCIILIDIKNDQLFRFMTCDLPAKLTSNRATAAGNKDCFSFNVLEDLFHIYFDRISSKQIFDCYCFHLA